MHHAIAQYRKLDVTSRVESASPQELVQLLFDGALAKLQAAKGCIERGDLEGRSAALNSAVSIVEGLQGSLDLDKGGPLASNLDGLYSYILRLLWQANRDNNGQAVVECTRLLGTVSEAWATLGAEVSRPADVDTQEVVS